MWQNGPDKPSHGLPGLVLHVTWGCHHSKAPRDFTLPISLWKIGFPGFFLISFTLKFFTKWRFGLSKDTQMLSLLLQVHCVATCLYWSKRSRPGTLVSGLVQLSSFVLAKLSKHATSLTFLIFVFFCFFFLGGWGEIENSSSLVHFLNTSIIWG